MQEYKYKFSVIIPVYNVEKYLEETIQSVINQTIGFEENIQIILVNDGSPDKSEEVCLKYQKMYPNNIQYVYQENSGVSAARNNGFKYAKGKYINYLDSDDKWSKDAFEKAYKMLEENQDIDVVAFRMKYFEAKNHYHTLDYKFNEDKIVNIYIDYDHIQLHVTSSIIRYTALANKEYDTRIKYAEDAKLLYEIILGKGKYGIIASTLFYYRRRALGNSAINLSKQNKEWYFETMDLVYKFLFDLSKEKYGKVIPYVQYFFMYDCQWRLKNPIVDCLTEEEKNEYLDNFKTLLKEVEDYVIVEQKNIYYEEKVHTLCLKHGYDVREKFECREHGLYLNDLLIYALDNKHICEIRLINIANDELEIEGTYADYLPEEDVELYFETNTGNKYEIDINKKDIYNELTDMAGQVYLTRTCFKTKIPLKDVKKIDLMINYKKHHKCKVSLSLHILTHLTQKFKNQYLISKDNKYIISAKNNSFIIENYSKKKHCVREIKYMTKLLSRNKRRAFIYRNLYYITKPFIKKDIWIVSDRTNAANDNGMHMFKYLIKNEKKAKVYFTVSKKLAPKDYITMKKIGPVLNHDSLKYKLLFLHSKYIISSQFDDWVINAFDKHNKYMMDLYKFDFIFLQHGVIKDNLSRLLHRFNKDMKIFITTNEAEYNSILNGYGCTKEQVKLTGLARYDNLKNKETSEKVIAFMPTWRRNVSAGIDKETGTRPYMDYFKDTEYFNRYNNLINDKKLLETMKKYGYKGVFVVHPSHIAQAVDYKANDVISVETTIPDYQGIFNSASILISDYSSVAIDFAYLKKPVIYYQFDEDTFFNQHIYKKGYYDYKKDGFGPVITDHEKCIDKIIEYIENNAKMEKKYKDRVDKFFKYNDSNNCERIYNEILLLNMGGK